MIARVSSDGKEAEVSVTDTGIGIAERDIPSVFKEFSQISVSTKRIYEGTGLGVPISKELVHCHGGRFDVWSEVGKGSTFLFTLPIWEGLGDDAEHENYGTPDVNVGSRPFDGRMVPTALLNVCELPKVDISSKNSDVLENGNGESLETTSGKNMPHDSSQKKKRNQRSILCVDDNEVNLLILGRYLSSTYQLLTASSGMEALSLLDEESVDLVLMDVMMPEMDGYETTEILRKRLPSLPVLFVSAKVEEARGYECGGNGYILKPVERKKILKKIAEYLK